MHDSQFKGNLLSHADPLKPSIHRQVWVPSVSIQVPPFRHGFMKQRFSTVKINMYKIKNVR